jgi:aryl-alcohol dehydrogenase-like predicted oxidoreductase
MSSKSFRTLGRSGLVVSPMCLGTMTFGAGNWNADETTARAIFDGYRKAGGNFVDTADIYSGGESETLVGKFIEATHSRDEIVLATKFAFNQSASPLMAGPSVAEIPTLAGLALRTFIAPCMRL